MNLRGWLAVVLLLGLVAFVAVALPHLERTPPTIEVAPAMTLGPEAQRAVVELEDLGAGLRSYEARLLAGGGEKTLVAHRYPGNWLTGGATARERDEFELNLDAGGLSLPEGSATLVVTARDWSWWGGFSGNAAQKEIDLTIDLTPPEISLETGVTYIAQGGSGVAVYRIDEPSRRNGVQVGEVFFQGYPLPAGNRPAKSQGGDRYAALFAVPVEAPSNPAVHVVAEDTAGNRGAVRYDARVSEQRFRVRSIALTQPLLERILADFVPPQGSHSGGHLVEVFQRVNGELRRRSEEEIRQLASGSQPDRLWSGAFEQMRGTEVTSKFAERRIYLLEGEEVAEARHYGFDLASTAHAEVAAAASGVVLHAGELGIYGKLVLLDHGMGLTSLYGHLSSIEVEVGQRVTKGAVLGRSGETGLAGGDHLHFAVLVGGTYVNPLEWWDPEWVRSHVEVRLEAERP